MKDRYRKYRISRIADNQIRDLREIRSLLLHTIIRRFAESYRRLISVHRISKGDESHSYHILIS